jgi:hypothetical protein
MALSEEGIVRLLQDAVSRYFDSLDTQAKWIDFINIVDKQTVKAFIQNALNTTANNYDASAVSLAARADDLEDLATIVGNL